jgi:hypothetical protein
LTDDETIEEPLQIEEPPQEGSSLTDEETIEEPSHEGFKIESLEDLRRVLVIAQGGNPDAQQSINDFLKFDNNIERTNLPSRRDVVLMDPFSIIADALSIAFMAKGGEKSKQFVELMKQTPSLVDLQTMGSGETPKGGIMNRIFGGSKE